MMLTAVLMPAPEGGFTALNPETGTTSEGESIEEAIANLREATELYLEEFPLGRVDPERTTPGGRGIFEPAVAGGPAVPVT